MIRLYHTTHLKLLPSILRRGLETRRDRRGHGRIWLHTYSQTIWAVRHLAGAHKWHLDEMWTLRVERPRYLITRNRRGIWYTEEDIPRSFISHDSICLECGVWEPPNEDTLNLSLIHI